LLVSRQGKVRLTKWFTVLSQKEKQRIVKEVASTVLARRSRLCNALEYKGAATVIDFA
jgi:AP-1 complex subunit sigma 1/2